MTDLVKDALSSNLLLMKIFGIYPIESLPIIVYYMHALFCYVSFTVPLPVLVTTFFIVNEITDLGMFCDDFFMISQIGILIIKLIPFKIYHKDVVASVKMLQIPIFNNWTPQQQYIIDDVIQSCKMMFRFFGSFCFLSLVTWSLRPWFISERIFPIHVWLPYDGLQSNIIYLPTYCFLVMGVTNAALGNAGLDTLISGLTYQAAGQIRILKNNLENLNERVDDQLSKESEMNNLEKEKLKAFITYNAICECVKHHEAICVFVEKIEKTYTTVVFTQFLASILVICISCLRLSMMEPFTLPFFGQIIFTITMFSEVFLYCYYGTILYDESLSLTNSIYTCTWYEIDAKSKKALIIFMERSKRPMMLTAGKLLDLSLYTFTMIVRRSYSLLAVLRNY